MAMIDKVPADAPKGSCVCFKCSGSGKFYSGGMVLNGVYTGKVGPCYGCRGKGWQSPSDKARNRVYWRHYARISL